VQVKGLTGVVRIGGARDHTLAVKANGTAWAWGDNRFGNLGDGSTAASDVPVQVNGPTNVKFVAGGRDHSIAIETDGSVWAWGWNQYGQLGDGTKTNRLAPVRVKGIAPAVQVAAGANHSLARLEVGAVWAWGHERDAVVATPCDAGVPAAATRRIARERLRESQTPATAVKGAALDCFSGARVQSTPRSLRPCAARVSLAVDTNDVT